jgi:hypothetical protein
MYHTLQAVCLLFDPYLVTNLLPETFVVPRVAELAFEAAADIG